jgi:hypothetical protein
MMFDPQTSQAPDAAEKGRSGGGRTPPECRRPGHTAANDIEAAPFVGPLIIALVLFIIGLVWVLP